MAYGLRARRLAVSMVAATLLLAARRAGASPQTELITPHHASLSGFVSPAGLGGTSQDGRYTVFVSNAPNVVAGTDTNNTLDVFLYDDVAATITLVSHSAGAPTTAANGQSLNPSISADGNWVAFESYANDLVAGVSDSNGTNDIYLWERATGATTLVSGRNGSLPRRSGLGYSVAPSISSDGAFVAFYSAATDLVPGVTGVVNVAVYLYDRAAGSLSLVSHSAASATAAGNASAYFPLISGDGQFVAYQSAATNLVAAQVDAADSPDAFLYSRATDVNVLISRTTAGAATAANASSQVAGLSSDGAWAVFTSTASAASLVSGATDANGSSDVFVFERATGTVRLASHAAGSSASSNGSSTAPVLSADGSRLAFESTGTNLVAGQVDANGQRDLFTADVSTLTVALVSHQPSLSSTAASSYAGYASIAADGSRIGYLSGSTNLVAGQTGAGEQVFTFTVSDGVNAMVSHANASSTQAGNASAGSVLRVAGDGASIVFQSAATDLVGGPVQPGGASVVFRWKPSPGAVTRIAGPNVEPVSGFGDATAVAISRDGLWVALISYATNLLPGSANGAAQVYLWDVSTHTLQLVSHGPGGVPGNGLATGISISADGRYVAYSSQGLNLVAGQAGDVPGSDDVFLWDRQTDATTLVSHAAGLPSTVGNGASTSPEVSADGSRVVFLTAATNLQSGIADGNSQQDVYIWDRASGVATLMSASAGTPGATANGMSFGPHVSDDGGVVEFASWATDLVSGQVDTNSFPDVFVHDVASGQNALVSHAFGAPATACDTGGTNAATGAVLSGDGSAIAFTSAATNLLGTAVAGGQPHVYRYLVGSGTNTLVSHAAGAPGVAANGFAALPSISRTGARIAFDSFATDLVSGVTDGNGTDDAFVWDAGSDRATLISHTAGSGSTAADSTASPLAISADGSWVLFVSYAGDPLPGLVDTNRSSDLYVAEISTGDLALISHAALGPSVTGNRGTYSGSLAGDGQRLAFLADASDLIAGDFNDARDAFLSSLGLDFFSLAPCRVYDSRLTTPLASGSPRVLNLTGGACGVPPDAKAVSINVTVTQPTGGGFLSGYPANASVPSTSTVNFNAGRTIANNAIVRLDTTGAGAAAFLAVVNGSGTVHVIVDVNGYFR